MKLSVFQIGFWFCFAQIFSFSTLTASLPPHPLDYTLYVTLAFVLHTFCFHSKLNCSSFNQETNFSYTRLIMSHTLTVLGKLQTQKVNNFSFFDPALESIYLISSSFTPSRACCDIRHRNQSCFNLVVFATSCRAWCERFLVIQRRRLLC